MINNTIFINTDSECQSFHYYQKNGNFKSVTFSIIISFLYSKFPNRSSAKDCEMWFVAKL